MKFRTSDLAGVPLEFAAASAVYSDGREVVIAYGMCQVQNAPGSQVYSRFTLNWWWCGPIITRFKVDLEHLRETSQVRATIRDGERVFTATAGEGQDLAAAMRCLVDWRMGPEVEIPDDIGHVPESLAHAHAERPVA